MGNTYIVMYPDNVKTLREEKDMSIWDLAEAAGISVQTARKAERGGRVAKGTARRVVMALGVKPSEIWPRVVESA